MDFDFNKWTESGLVDRNFAPTILRERERFVSVGVVTWVTWIGIV